MVWVKTTRGRGGRKIQTAYLRSSPPARLELAFGPGAGFVYDGPCALPPACTIRRRRPAFSEVSSSMNTDPLAFHSIDHVEFYVSNARQAAHFYRTTLGLVPLAYAGLETGVRDRASWLLGRGHVRFLLTSPLDAGHRAGNLSRTSPATGTGSRTSPSASPTPTPPTRKPCGAARSPCRSRRSSRTATGGSCARASPPTATRSIPSSSARATRARSPASVTSRTRRPRPTRASPPSTTSSATSNSATWTSGSGFTAT